MGEINTSIQSNSDHNLVEEFYKSYVYPNAWTGVFTLNGGWGDRELVDPFVSSRLEPKRIFIEALREFPEDLDQIEQFQTVREKDRLKDLAVIIPKEYIPVNTEKYLVMFPGPEANNFLELIKYFVRKTGFKAQIELRSYIGANLPEVGSPIYMWETTIEFNPMKNDVHVETSVWAGKWLPTFAEPVLAATLDLNGKVGV